MDWAPVACDQWLCSSPTLPFSALAGVMSGCLALPAMDGVRRASMVSFQTAQKCITTRAAGTPSFLDILVQIFPKRGQIHVDPYCLRY